MATDCPPLITGEPTTEFVHPPAIAEVAHLRARNLPGALYFSGCLFVTVASIALSLASHWAIWATGQVVLSLALLQWFVLIHEAGHKTLFRSGWANKITGHLAGYFALIPFESWKAVHGIHHRWTGWQDLDMTTAALVPRPLARWEKLSINLAWRYWVPLFSILYRVGNYWSPVRLWRQFPRGRTRWRLMVNLIGQAIAYSLTVYWLGWATALQVGGLALLLTLTMQDPLILSQHTHIPMEQSHGQPVLPFSPLEQQQFTRSLEFPAWFARYVLLNLNAHELHHMYSQVPGYLLDRIEFSPDNTIRWWRWLLLAKRLPGEVFLFQNRHQTGFDL